MKYCLALALALSLALALTGAALPRAGPPAKSDLTAMMVKSYDLLEAGQLDQAADLYREVLRRDPGNPLALNNLGAIEVKKKNYRQALTYLEQAWVRARGYKVKVNRVCDVGGSCLAFRPLAQEYGDQDLGPLIQLNLELVKAALAAAPKSD
jgi:Flp pilus assembly protein TadD